MEEFILRNADPIWLHQEGLWEYIDLAAEDEQETTDGGSPDSISW